MSKLPRRKYWLVGGISVSIALIVAVAVTSQPRPSEGPQSTPQTSFPIPPYSESRYLNTDNDARYVGNKACAGCHVGNHASYLLTAHSRALGDVEPATEPPDVSFYHALSDRSYRVYRQDGQLRHEEILRTATGKEISRVDLPVRYRMGSGTYARTYLIEVDGFLQESPITWYETKQKWDMSPGYDAKVHLGFDRPINVVCLSCHAGHFDLAGTMHRPKLLEKAIGCENCHGPGSKHIAFHQTHKPAAGVEDLTIVNPAKLPRARLESVCAVCHLQGPAAVYLRGRHVTDFRPGTLLTDYRVDYRIENGGGSMTVVGHVEQLRQSKCYQSSSDLTCITCHDPHLSRKPKDPTALYRQKCLDCHATKPCRLEEKQRLVKEPSDNCAACHMPRGDTEVPHLAFTHHRIGLHGAKAAPESDRRSVPVLVPTDDISHLSVVDQRRNLGLAYLEASKKPEMLKFAAVFRDRARELLDGVSAAGLVDGETATALAEIYWTLDRSRSRAFAKEALAANDMEAESRTHVLLGLATIAAEERDFESAIGLLRQSVLLRRDPMDWGLLGGCYRLQHRPNEALPPLLTALAIRPDEFAVHAELSQVYQQLGDVERARAHDEKARWLLEHRMDRK